MSTDEQAVPRRTILFITAFFFLSGACGLIYQVVWTRHLSLIFGHTTFAVSTVITAFMGGLALGSRVWGKWADRPGRAGGALEKLGGSPVLLMYGILEILVGLYCLMTPALFGLVEAAYLEFSTWPFYPMSILRFLLCCLVLLFPTFCMGGTLPLLTKFLTPAFRDVGGKLSSLYFINTLGAAAGTFLAGFYLIRLAGLTASLQCAAVLNIGIGALVYVLNRGLGKSGEPDGPAGESAGAPPEKGGDLALLVAVFAVTGFASMMYELCWTRALSLSLGSSTYAFSAMLTTFLLGIALGSRLYGRFAQRRTFSLRDFGRLEMAIAFACLVTVPLLGKLPHAFIGIFPLVKGSYDLVMLADFLFAALTMLVPTTLMGFVFPLVGALATRRFAELGRSVGTIYAVNTVGCILGSFLTGFFLIPMAGIQGTLRLAVLLNFAAGAALLRGDLRKPAPLAAAAAFLVLVFVTPAWNAVLMHSGAAIYAERFSTSRLNLESMGRSLLFQRDGITSSVSVFSHDGVVSLHVNGKTDASTGSDMVTQLFLGYLPVLHHPDPRDVFIIGLGSGITAKAVLDFPSVRAAVCAELEPSVVEANRFFAPFNGNVLQNPRLRLVVDDGRNALLAGGRQYDVIISEPSNPWIAGVASLYTRDFYVSSLRSLRDGGVFCQWLQIYNMQPSDIRMVLKTFYSVFGHGAVWRSSNGDVLLLGSGTPMVLDRERLRRAFWENPAFRRAMAGIDVPTPDVLYASYIADAEKLAPLFLPASTNTDDLPLLEFSAPVSLYSDTFAVNMKGLLSYKEGLLPPTIPPDDPKNLSKLFYMTLADNYDGADPRYAQGVLDRALERFPDDFEVAAIRALKYRHEKRFLLAQRELERYTGRKPLDRRGWYHLALLYEEQGMDGRAGDQLERAYALAPGDLEVARAWGRHLLDAMRLEEAEPVVRAALARFPGDGELHLFAGRLAAARRDYARATAELKEAIARGGDPLAAGRELFAVYRAAGDAKNAILTGLELHRRAPGDVEVVLETARLLARQGDLAAARELLLSGLQREPYNAAIIGMLEALGALKAF